MASLTHTLHLSVCLPIRPYIALKMVPKFNSVPPFLVTTPVCERETDTQKYEYTLHVPKHSLLFCWEDVQDLEGNWIIGKKGEEAGS